MREIAGVTERISRAAGPDRGIDDDMALAGGYTLGPYPFGSGVSGVYWFDPTGKLYGSVSPQLSRSVDSILALIEVRLPGWFVGLQQNRGVSADSAWTAYLEGPDGQSTEPSASSPALALCRALLIVLGSP